MRSSSRIIRGLDAAELPSWSVELIGSRYENPVQRMLSQLEKQEAEKAAEAVIEPSEEELRLKAWEQSLHQREAAIEQLEQEAIKRAEELGRQNGYEAGWNAAHTERVALVQAAQTIEEEFTKFKESLSEKLLDLAVMVSKKIVVDTIDLHPEQAAALLGQILESMQLHSKSVTLRAHPSTIRVLEAQFGDQKMMGNLRMLEDPKQLQGGFILQHPEGEVDATLQTRWLHAIESLGKNDPITPDDLSKDTE